MLTEAGVLLKIYSQIVNLQLKRSNLNKERPLGNKVAD